MSDLRLLLTGLCVRLARESAGHHRQRNAVTLTQESSDHLGEGHRCMAILASHPSVWNSLLLTSRPPQGQAQV